MDQRVFFAHPTLESLFAVHESPLTIGPKAKSPPHRRKSALQDPAATGFTEIDDGSENGPVKVPSCPATRFVHLNDQSVGWVLVQEKFVVLR